MRKKKTPTQWAAQANTNIGTLSRGTQPKRLGTASAVSSATATPCSRLKASAARSRPTSRTYRPAKIRA